MIIQNKNY